MKKSGSGNSYPAKREDDRPKRVVNEKSPEDLKSVLAVMASTAKAEVQKPVAPSPKSSPDLNVEQPKPIVKTPEISPLKSALAQVLEQLPQALQVAPPTSAPTVRLVKNSVPAQSQQPRSENKSASKVENSIDIEKIKKMLKDTPKERSPFQ